MSTPSPLPTRLLQTLGISTSLILAGSVLSTSLTTVPRLLESPPTLLLQQWGHMYETGKKTGPPIAGLASASFFYLAWKSHFETFNTGEGLSVKARIWLYTLAGVLSVGIVPYTFAVLLDTNRKLLRKVQLTRIVELRREDEVELREAQRSAHQLVDWWGVLNLGRGVMLVGSGVLGMWAALG